MCLFSFSPLRERHAYLLFQGPIEVNLVSAWPIFVVTNATVRTGTSAKFADSSVAQISKPFSRPTKWMLEFTYVITSKD